LPPQFELSWRDVVKLKPELQNRIHINTVMTNLRNQDFPTSYGVTDIFPDSANQEKMIFAIDQEIFSSCILLDIINRIEMIPSGSCFFKNIVPENRIVEYSSPNIAKPFHFGHFRSTIIGNFISNMYQYVGHRVTKLNYVGDWGMQFGILAVGFKKFGDEEMLLKDPLHHLYQVYKEANEQNAKNPSFNDEARAYYKKMEEGDVETLSLWKKLRDLSLKEMDTTYKRLNVHFDEIQGEAMYANKVEELYNDLLKQGIASCQEDGSIDTVIDSTGDKTETAVLRKSDGTSLYLSRDLAAAVDRQRKYHFDSLFYVVDSTQALHFKYLIHILKAMGNIWASDIHHIPFGRILNFSTRKGTVVFLDDILNEAKERTMEGMENSPNTKVIGNFEEVADILGISSLIINDFSVRRKRDYPFDWSKVLNMQGNSGITLQYCNARLNNIKENCGIGLSLNCEFSCLIEPEAVSVIEQLASFFKVI
ncbi:probable arginine--tRNA ligase, mitochondrial, partial [Nephila pilipes]